MQTHCIKSSSNIYFGYLLESPQRGDSNKYPKYMFYEDIRIKHGLSNILFCPLGILYNSKFIIMATFLGTNAVVVTRVHCIQGVSVISSLIYNIKIHCEVKRVSLSDVEMTVKAAGLVTNTVDPDQTVHSPAFDLGLHVRYGLSVPNLRSITYYNGQMVILAERPSAN